MNIYDQLLELGFTPSEAREIEHIIELEKEED